MTAESRSVNHCLQQTKPRLSYLTCIEFETTKIDGLGVISSEAFIIFVGIHLNSPQKLNRMMPLQNSFLLHSSDCLNIPVVKVSIPQDFSLFDHSFAF